MNIALLAGSYYEDATMRSVLSGLRGPLSRASHRAVIVSRRAPAAGELSFAAAPSRAVVRVESARDLAALVRRGAIDVVHLHFSGLFRRWLSPLAGDGFLAGARLVVTFQDFDHPELPRHSAGQLGSLRRLLRRADAVTAVSGFLRDRVERALPQLRGRIRVVANGVPSSSRGDVSAPGGRPYILSVGRLAPYKGTDLLVMAFAGLGERGVDLVLCGAPFHKSHVARLVAALGLQDRVRMTGLLPPRKVRALLEGCLFHAGAPRAETFGMAVMEAMAAGKAVLAARVGGIPEYLRDGVNGLLVPPKDVAALSQGLSRLIDDPGLRARLAAAGRQTAWRFRWERIADEYLAVYGA